MATVALYPAVTTREDARDAVARLVWHVAPFAAQLEAISIVATLGPLQIAALAPPACLASGASAEALEGPLGDALTVYPARGTDAAAWTRLLEASDILHVWQMPRAETGPFATLEALEAAAAAAGTTVYVADPHATRADTARLAEAGLALAGTAEALAAEGRARLQALAATLTADRAHLVGAGPSLAQLDHFDLAGADVIASGALAADPARFAALAPTIVCAADAALHVGPSAAAATMRESLNAALAAHDFALVVPLRDLPLHRAFIPAAHHDRLIGVPFEIPGEPIPRPRRRVRAAAGRRRPRRHAGARHDAL